MALSASDFAILLPDLRPGLLSWAAQKRPCSPDDAEDLLGEAVRLALFILPEYKEETGDDGLRRWLTGILRCVILNDRQRAARRPKTVAIDTVAQQPAPPPMVAAEPFADELLQLPARQRDLVRGWLAGRTQAELAREYGVHRNTVGNRLELAFQALRTACPDGDELYYSSGLIDFCSHITIYHKAKQPWRNWFSNHPPDWRLRLHPPLRLSRLIAKRIPARSRSAEAPSALGRFVSTLRVTDRAA